MCQFLYRGLHRSKLFYTCFSKDVAYTAKWVILQRGLMFDELKAGHACQMLVNISSSRLPMQHWEGFTSRLGRLAAFRMGASFALANMVLMLSSSGTSSSGSRDTSSSSMSSVVTTPLIVRQCWYGLRSEGTHPGQKETEFESLKTGVDFV